MSGIAALYQRAGSPVLPAVLGNMEGALDYGPPCVWRRRIAGPTGLTQQVWADVGQEEAGLPVFYDAVAQISLVWDGRLDNRSELLQTLALGNDTGDAAVVAGAYQRWGAECPAHLWGDFALVLWDERRQQLFCARDIIGARPFYYYVDGQKFLCATHLAQLLASGLVTRRTNEGYAAERLSVQYVSSAETLYQGIMRLPPAHALTVSAQGWHCWRYWDITAVKEVRHRDEAGYAEHFRHLLREAVACRWDESAGILLSGGLDSTGIATVAHSLRQEGRLAAPQIRTFSQVYPGWTCDESEYINATAQQLDLRANLFPPYISPAQRYTDDLARYQDVPDYPNGATLDELYQEARHQGVRTLLTGIGGDEWLSGSFYHLADLLRCGYVTEFWRTAHYLTGARGLGQARCCWQYGCKPLLPLSLQNAFHKWRGYQPVPAWVTPEFARRTALAERLREPPPAFPRNAALSDIVSLYLCGAMVSPLEMNARQTGRFGLQLSYPFHDRRVIEFCLGVPETQRRRGFTTKYVLRHALQGQMPEKTRRRTDKAEFSRIFVTDLQRHGGAEYFTSLHLAQRGWAHGGRVRRMYDEMAERYAAQEARRSWHLWPLWFIYSFDLMMRHDLI